MIAWLQQKWWDASTRRINKRRRKRVAEYGEVWLAQKTWEQRKPAVELEPGDAT